MYVGKYLIFVLGMVAAVAIMFAVSGVNQNDSSRNATEKVDESSQIERATASPFAVSDGPAQELVSAAADGDDLPVSIAATAMELAIEELTQRVEVAENRIEELEVELAEYRFNQNQSEPEFIQDLQTELSSAGFEPTVIAQIQSIRNDLQLERLELRDRAIREGWVNTDRFRQERRELNDGRKLRESLGDEGYNNLLVAEGRNNRVRIESVIENSAADIAGIEIGDIVIRYAEQQIFNFRDLQQATTEGDRNKPVAVQISRSGELIDYVIPRGPMGVTLSGVLEDPS